MERKEASSQANTHTHTNGRKGEKRRGWEGRDESTDTSGQECVLGDRGRGGIVHREGRMRKKRESEGRGSGASEGGRPSSFKDLPSLSSPALSDGVMEREWGWSGEKTRRLGGLHTSKRERVYAM